MIRYIIGDKTFNLKLLNSILIINLLVACNTYRDDGRSTSEVKNQSTPSKKRLNLTELLIEISMHPDNYQFLIDKIALQNNDYLPGNYQEQLSPLIKIAVQQNAQVEFIEYITSSIRVKPDELIWIVDYFPIALDYEDSIRNFAAQNVKASDTILVEAKPVISKNKYPTTSNMKFDLVGHSLGSDWKFSDASEIKSLEIIGKNSSENKITYRVEMIIGDDKYRARADIDYMLENNKWIIEGVIGRYFDDFIKTNEY